MRNRNRNKKKRNAGNCYQPYIQVVKRDKWMTHCVQNWSALVAKVNKTSSRHNFIIVEIITNNNNTYTYTYTYTHAKSFFLTKFAFKITTIGKMCDKSNREKDRENKKCFFQKHKSLGFNYYYHMTSHMTVSIPRK